MAEGRAPLADRHHRGTRPVPGRAASEVTTLNFLLTELAVIPLPGSPSRNTGFENRDGSYATLWRAYLPIDASYPDARIAQLLIDAGRGHRRLRQDATDRLDLLRHGHLRDLPAAAGRREGGRPRTRARSGLPRLGGCLNHKALPGSVQLPAFNCGSVSSEQFRWLLVKATSCMAL